MNEELQTGSLSLMELWKAVAFWSMEFGFSSSPVPRTWPVYDCKEFNNENLLWCRTQWPRASHLFWQADIRSEFFLFKSKVRARTTEDGLSRSFIKLGSKSCQQNIFVYSVSNAKNSIDLCWLFNLLVAG